MEMIDGSVKGLGEFKIFTGLLKSSRGSDGKMRLHGIASSTTKDLHGDIMTASAIEDMEAAANRNLTIFLNHSYNVPEDVGGSVERAVSRVIGVDSDGNPSVDLAFDIVVNDANPRAVAAFEAIERGTKLGLSIGAMIPENGAKRQKNGSYVIDHVELLETSIVGIPANPRSWVEYAAKSLRGKSVTEEIANPAGDESAEPAQDIAEVEAPAEVTEVAEPDVTDATVTVETPTASITVETSDEDDSQPTRESEADDEAVLDETADGDDDRLGDTATRSFEGVDLSRTLGETLELLRQTTRDLVETRAALVEAQAAKAAAERERDAAEAERTNVLTQTKQILDRVAASPLVRKTAMIDAKRDFRARFEGIYDEEFLKMIERNAND